MTIRQLIALQMQWWERANAAPLVTTYAPVAAPYGGFDVDVPAAQIAERKIANLRACAAAPADVLPVAYPNLGTAFLPALAGARFEYDGATSWAHPCAASAAELRIAPLDTGHALWRRFEELMRALLLQWSWDTYVPGLTVMLGPMDILAAMLGPETLAMELYADPDAVARAAMDAAGLFLQVHDAQCRMLADAGLTDGMADWMVTWLPGRGVCMSEDFAALVGEAHFRQFFAPADGRIFSQMDSGMLHLHSGALATLPGVLDLPGLRAMELSNDPNGPDLDTLIGAARQVQARGLPLQMSNWERPLADDDIRRLLAALDPRGLKVTLQASSLDEARRLYDLAKGAAAASLDKLH